MYRSNELYESILKTIPVVFSIYNNVPLDPTYNNDKTYRFITFNKKEGEIKALPEFQHSVEKMKSNEQISSMENHMVGTHSSSFNIGALSQCLISFLYQLYNVSPEPTNDIINKAYQDFESFFYDDKFIKLDSTLLFNFQSSENEIDLGDGIKISRNLNNQDPSDYFGREKGYRRLSSAGASF